MALNKRWIVLREWIEQHDLKVGAEIGVWKGDTTHYLLKHTDVYLYAIDLWQTSPGYDTPKWDHNLNKKIAYQKINQFPNRCKIIEGVSWQVADQIPDGSLDFVFIDGDHSEAGVSKDIQAYTPKVKAGGYIMGHDWDWPSVQAGVRQHRKDTNLLENGIWWYKNGE